jgi:Arc/MetJ-type ribon-helix-helix transcriptional regulator
MTNKNVTLALPTSLMQRVRSLVDEGYKTSINNLVRDALEFYLKEVEKEKIRQAMLKAAKDPLFLADVGECVEDFRHVDKECLTEW